MKKALAGDLWHVPQAIRQGTPRWFEFEPEVLNPDENLDSLNRIHQELLAKAEATEPQRKLLDSGTETPVSGEPKHDSRSGPLSICPQPFLLSDGEGASPAANLQAENAPAASECDQPLRRQEVTATLSSDSRSGLAPQKETANYRPCLAVVAMTRQLPALPQEVGVARTIQPSKRARLHKQWWKAVATALIALVISWIAYSHRRPSSATALQKSNALQQEVPSVEKQLSTDNASQSQTAAVATPESRSGQTKHRRVRVRDNEIDIGEDVTVRYFAPQHRVVSPTRPVASGSQSADRSLPVPETSTPPNPTQ
jgi:hypothetical protein